MSILSPIALTTSVLSRTITFSITAGVAFESLFGVLESFADLLKVYPLNPEVDDTFEILEGVL